MLRDIHTRLLAATCVLLAVTLLVVATASIGHTPALPNAATDDAMRPVLPPPLPALAALVETTSRPVFIATRREETGGRPLQLSAGGGQSDLILGRYRLVGVISSGGRSTLKLQLAGGGKAREIGVGDNLDGWTVERITTNYLDLLAGTTRERIPLTRQRRK